MIIMPAIDLKDGQCVRLLRGDFETVHKVAPSPFDAAMDFKLQSAEWVHVVDLDGTLAGKCVNLWSIDHILASGLKVQAGGGVRTMESVEHLLSIGIKRIVLGTAALRDPDFVHAAAQKYGTQIAVAIGARDGKAAAEGWHETQDVDFIDLAKNMEQIGVGSIIFTDIGRDGTLGGPNLEALERLQSSTSCNIIANGGIGVLQDILALRDMGLYGAIIGKAIYSKTIDLSTAIKEAKRN